MAFVKSWAGTLGWVLALLGAIVLTWTQYGWVPGAYVTLAILGIVSAAYDYFGVR